MDGSEQNHNKQWQRFHDIIDKPTLIDAPALDRRAAKLFLKLPGYQTLLLRVKSTAPGRSLTLMKA
jgi:hypothetical protein